MGMGECQKYARMALSLQILASWAESQGCRDQNPSNKSGHGYSPASLDVAYITCTCTIGRPTCLPVSRFNICKSCIYNLIGLLKYVNRSRSMLLILQ